MHHLKVPQDRIGALIGAGGETMRAIEDAGGVRLNIDSQTGAVEVDPVDDPVAGLTAMDVVKAIGRGFPPTDAMQLFDEELCTFELIDLTNHTRNSNDLQRQKGRVIGEGGRTRELIEELSGAVVVIRGSTVGIIGAPEEVAIVRHAVGMLLDGAPHGAVYAYLERRHAERAHGAGLGGL
ncbi:MAG: KH domain-containing protein [Haloferacaceae archaeon]|nr:KH domain-containing protein [Haloferacaceae archaeon]